MPKQGREPYNRARLQQSASLRSLTVVGILGQGSTQLSAPLYPFPQEVRTVPDDSRLERRRSALRRPRSSLNLIFDSITAHPKAPFHLTTLESTACGLLHLF